MERLFKGLNQSLGWMFSLLVITLPLFLWGSYSQLPSAATLAGTFTFLAKSSAFVGFAGYAWSLILGARLRFIEPLFHGLDKLYIAHRIIGGTSIILIIMHPLFLSLRAWIRSFDNVLSLWSPFSMFFLQMGLVAFVVMVFAVIVTYWVKVKHQTFIRIHSMLGWVLIPSMLHVFLSHGAVANNEPLRKYMLVLSVLGLLAFMYHTVFGKWLMKKYRYKIIKVAQLGDNIAEIYLKPLLRPISYSPGQLAFVSIIDPSVDEEPHPFALTQHHNSRVTSIVVKNLGDWTAKMPLLQKGSTVYLEGPHGTFSYKNTDNNKQIWIAGGIGVTPFLAMARSLRKNSKLNVDMYYCTRTSAEAVFFNELHKIANKQKHFRLIGVCEESEGFITADKIEKLTPDLKERDIFICGPPIMMKTLQQQLLQKGLFDVQIHFEDFSF